MFINLGLKIKDNNNFKKAGIKASFFDSFRYFFHQPQINKEVINGKLD